MKLLVLFLEYNTGKYKNSFELLKSYVDKFKGCKKNYYIIDNFTEEDYFKKISENVFRIGGDNSSWEFSGWQKGVELLEENNIEYDVILFANDAFLAYGWSILEKDLNLELLRVAIRNNSAIGQVDTKGIKLEAFGQDVSNWICTNCFFMPRKIVEGIGTVVTIDENKLNKVVNKKYSKESYFLEQAPLNENYKKMAIRWLTEEWHSKFEINEKNWDRFRGKLKAMLNESLLSAKIKQAGFRIEHYKLETKPKTSIFQKIKEIFHKNFCKF